MSDQSLNEKGKMPKKFSVKSGDKSAAGGLTAKGVKRYRAANPGSKLKTAVTTKPSKLKKGSKSASRRKSFCARMGGMKKRLTSAKTARDPDSRINKALRKWNCSTDVNPNALQQMAEMIIETLTNQAGKPVKVPKGKKKKYRGMRASAPVLQGLATSTPKPEKEKVKEARLNLAEMVVECWKTHKKVGTKMKGGRIVNDCVPKSKKNESDDPRMKTTRASIKQAGGDPDAYSKEKAKKDPQPVTKGAKPSRSKTLAKSGGKFRRERIQPPKGSEGPSAPTRQVPVRKDAKGGKENFKKGTSEKPMSRRDVNKMGVRGQESKIAAKKRAMGKKIGAANIKLMKDMGVLKFDKQGRRIRK